MKHTRTEGDTDAHDERNPARCGAFEGRDIAPTASRSAVVVPSHAARALMRRGSNGSGGSGQQRAHTASQIDAGFAGSGLASPRALRVPHYQRSQLHSKSCRETHMSG